MKALSELLPKSTAFLLSDCSPPPRIKKRKSQEFLLLRLQETSSWNDFTDKSMPFPTELFHFFYLLQKITTISQ